MKATVIVTLKPTVLDPQGMTIQRSLGSLGLDDITDVRQGKIFDVRLKNGSREPAWDLLPNASKFQASRSRPNSFRAPY